ncbi:MAG TPA: DUF4215 domain-containing protein [Candidatus Limnocylindrales bacterium]|nr:DUF4215 domain-containing protein [Candidatus Limnocylindrales bacterium]
MALSAVLVIAACSPARAGSDPTTAFASVDAPIFNHVRTVGRSYVPEAPTFDTSLFSLKDDGSGALLLRRWRQVRRYSDTGLGVSSLYASRDAGQQWAPASDSALPADAIVSSAPWDGVSSAGTTVAVELYRQSARTDDGYELGQAEHLVSRRSSDFGRTWSDDTAISTVLCGNCNSEYHQAAVASDGNGNWIVASIKSELVQTDTPPECCHNNRKTSIIVYYSFDDGRTWTEGAEVWSEEVVLGGSEFTEDIGSRHPLVAASGADGSWGLAWRGEHDGALRVARAADAASPWVLHPITPPGSADPLRRPDWFAYGGPSLATTASGAWLVAWEEELPGEQYGTDSDIYFSRSGDNGQSWGEPQPLGAYVEDDDRDDLTPSLATDGKGHVLAVWSSRVSLGWRRGAPAYIVSSISADDGLSWTAPTPVDPAASHDERQDFAPFAAGDSAGRWTVAWSTLPAETMWYWNSQEAEVHVAVAGLRCGNGTVEIGEQCDDGNAIDGDGCNSDCMPASCGNEVVEEGEECDGLELIDNHTCSANCGLSRCGDGERDVWTEACDDGNGEESDDCPGSCQPVSCGDGYVNAGEQCDDGNFDPTDGCKNCRFTYCGDHVLRSGVELCDDGNSLEIDACTEQCLPAVCGDGRVWIGVEDCDDPDGVRYGGACTPDCKLDNICGDPDADGTVSASDALSVIRYAVDLSSGCNLERCDIDGSGRVATDDALDVLHLSSGLDVVRQCPVGQWATFTLKDSRAFQYLQFDIDARSRGLDFDLGYHQGHCELIGNRASYVVGIAREGALDVAVFSIHAHKGPSPLVRCRIYRRHDATGDGPVSITVGAAVDSDLNESLPLPEVLLRLE